ncbi:PilX N-terminal domain-containing pilus assembly protein [Colwellia psychrerythraea]|uniref:Type 4 fimbrial biogenesis protein PilX, N-terminal domain containing protein n=1 Tax=Colwellia psychrerythraea TaxID=28229 RepID=A0A099KPI4_COLPS|nr:PilX N-terminal domain-containing pilus assembly protein [Colwellia psychrerythraea]KGJ91847.1 Type 4 fimbrial biogenesis protein PilX, N-terminal domain containing protein [Colwellia psychrerythraea]
MTKFHNKANQKGVVLVVSLVFLVALTAVAAALMQNSTTDMKMSGASEEKSVALQEVVSAVDEVIFNQVAPGQNNSFSRPVAGNFPIVDQNILLPGTATYATAAVNVANNQFNLDITCPHLKLASSTEVFSCNILTVTANRNYGRTGQSNISANSGIAQQLLK